MKIVINKTPIDQFTLIHAGAGVLAHHAGLTLWQTFVLGCAWDFALEPELKKAYPKAFPYPSPDSFEHALVDAVIPSVGWLITEWWKRRGR